MKLFKEGGVWWLAIQGEGDLWELWCWEERQMQFIKESESVPSLEECYRDASLLIQARIREGAE